MRFYWSRIIVIYRLQYLAYAVCAALLSGCSSVGRIFNPRSTTLGVQDAVDQAVTSSNLWWPFMLAGFLAIIAGVVNLVLLRGSPRLLIVGALLAVVPPVADVVVSSVMPWLAVAVGVSGLALLGIVAGRVLGRRDISKRATQRADHLMKSDRQSVTRLQAAKILTHLGDTDFRSDYKIGR